LGAVEVGRSAGEAVATGEAQWVAPSAARPVAIEESACGGETREGQVGGQQEALAAVWTGLEVGLTVGATTERRVVGQVRAARVAREGVVTVARTGVV